MSTEQTTWIGKQPGPCGGEACIRDTRITVWSLVAWRRDGKPDEWIRNEIPELTQEDLNEAWRYADARPSEIDGAMQCNIRR